MSDMKGRKQVKRKMEGDGVLCAAPSSIILSEYIMFLDPISAVIGGICRYLSYINI